MFHNLTAFDVSGNQLTGAFSTRSERLRVLLLTYVFAFSGEIPGALLRWKFVENRIVKLEGNTGLMLPSNIGELGDSVTKIDLSNHNLRGELSIRSDRFNRN